MIDWNRRGAWVYEKVASDVVNNSVAAFFIAGIIWLFSKAWLAAAKVLFWIALTIQALSIIHFAFTAIVGIIAVIALLSSHKSLKWALAGFCARLVGQVLALTALWLAAMAVGYWPL